MPSSYATKNLRFTFTLTNSNAVFQGTANQLQVSGLRASAVIKNSGIPAFPEASLRIYGMAQQDMNALAVVQTDSGKPQYGKNTVQVEADSGNGFSFVFSGQIFQAGPDYSGAPDVCLFVHAQNGGFDQLTAAQPTSFPGTANVADVAASIVSKMSMTFHNSGVTGPITNAYYSGTLPNQLRKLCEDTGNTYAPEGNQITISPIGVPRTDVTPFVLSPTSGLIGYPEVQGNGFLTVRSLFNPAFRYNGPLTIQGSDVVIDPGVPKTLNSLADGNWTIGPTTHTLESLKPGGAWMTEMTLYEPTAGVPVR